MNQKIKPIIKWTGGKYDEFPKFAHYIPSFNRYIEPFFGGGGVYFALQLKQPSLLNDKSRDLARFYSLLNSAAFKKELSHIAGAWESAGKLSSEITTQLLASFNGFVKDEVCEVSLQKQIAASIKNINVDDFAPLFDESFIIDPCRFTKKLDHSLNDKFRRIKAISKKENKTFAIEELAGHIETGVKSGFYLYMRGLMNQDAAGELRMTDEKATAIWYFVRELCYASMFRYNSRNQFNIPYGGTAYNKKNFRLKVEKLFSKEVKQLFGRSDFYNLDFADFISTVQPAEDDFIFLDPPYDSEFSEYDQNSFTRQDQVRLRDSIIKLPAKWMMVIKETEFIRDLYSVAGCKIIRFDKKYTYNVRGRNNRDTRHLIILNYEV